MKKLIIVVDMQNDFVDGSLGFQDALGVVERIDSKLSKNEVPIIFTRDTHQKDYLETQEGKNLPIVHCVENTSGWQIVDTLQKYITPKTRIFDKPTFGSHELGVYLKDNPVDEIEIMGLVSNICVISNAVIAKSALPEARIVVDRSLTSSFDKALNEACFEVMKGFQIEVI